MASRKLTKQLWVKKYEHRFESVSWGGLKRRIHVDARLPCLHVSPPQSCHPSRPSRSRSISASSRFMNSSLSRGSGHICGGDGSPERREVKGYIWVWGTRCGRRRFHHLTSKSSKTKMLFLHSLYLINCSPSVYSTFKTRKNQLPVSLFVGSAAVLGFPQEAAQPPQRAAVIPAASDLRVRRKTSALKHKASDLHEYPRVFMMLSVSAQPGELTVGYFNNQPFKSGLSNMQKQDTHEVTSCPLNDFIWRQHEQCYRRVRDVKLMRTRMSAVRYTGAHWQQQRCHVCAESVCDGSMKGFSQVCSFVFHTILEIKKKQNYISWSFPVCFVLLEHWAVLTWHHSASSGSQLVYVMIYTVVLFKNIIYVFMM